jgi:hypothetical protein
MAGVMGSKSPGIGEVTGMAAPSFFFTQHISVHDISVVDILHLNCPIVKKQIWPVYGLFELSSGGPAKEAIHPLQGIGFQFKMVRNNFSNSSLSVCVATRIFPPSGAGLV